MEDTLKREMAAVAKAGEERKEDLKARDEYKELAEAVLALPVGAGRVAQVKKAGDLTELSESNTDVRTGFMLALAKSGLDGDVRAQQLLLALAGVKTNRKEVEVSGERPATAVIYLPDNGRDAS